MAARQDSIEHLRGYIEALQPADSPAHGACSATAIVRGTAHVDTDMIPDLVEATVKAGTWNCPTMTVRQTWVPDTEFDAFLGRPEMRYMPPTLVQQWRGRSSVSTTIAAANADWTAADFTAARQMVAVMRELTKALHDAGAGVLLGTDVGNRLLIPGLSVHDEIRNLVDAGLTPFEAIRCGTRAPAEFLGRADEFGTVVPGARADLLLVERDPLADVSNLRRIAGVMTRGTWLSADDLRQRLDAQVDGYSAHQGRDGGVKTSPLASSDDSEFHRAYDVKWEGFDLGTETVVVKRRRDGTRLVRGRADLRGAHAGVGQHPTGTGCDGADAGRTF